MEIKDWLELFTLQLEKKKGQPLLSLAWPLPLVFFFPSAATIGTIFVGGRIHKENVSHSDYSSILVIYLNDVSLFSKTPSHHISGSDMSIKIKTLMVGERIRVRVTIRVRVSVTV
jgi:hypothetical protein